MRKYAVCIFGSGGVGKSSLTIQFVQGIFVTKYDPTIEDLYKKEIEVDEKKYSLEIFDTAGSDEFLSTRDSYIRDCVGFVLVYSITSRVTFNDLNAYYERILAIKNSEGQDQPPIILVGNKVDLKDQRDVSREEGEALAKKWKCTFLETSAKVRSNVQEIFYDLVRQLNRKAPLGGSRIPDITEEPRVVIDPEHQKSSSNNEGNCCCCLL